MGEDAPGHDSHGRGPIRPGRRVAALGDGPVGDVRVGADEVVRLDIPEHQGAVRLEAGADPDLRGAAADGLEGFLERQDEANRSARPEGHERDERLVLGVLFATEPAARVGREHANLGQRQMEETGDDPLEPVRVLDRAPDRDPIAVRGSDEGVWLDRELGDHRKAIRPLDDDIRGGRVDVAPAKTVLAEDVRGRERIAGAQRGVLNEWRGRVEGRGDREHGRQFLVLDSDEAGRLLGGVAGLGRDRHHRVAVIASLANRDDRPILELRTESRDRLWQICGADGQADAGDLEGGTRVDGGDPGPGAIERHELRVQHVVETDVGHVDLPARDPVEPADPRG